VPGSVKCYSVSGMTDEADPTLAQMLTVTVPSSSAFSYQ
jgi:hypothetical protein